VSKFEKLAALIESLLDLDMSLSTESSFKDLPGWDSVNAMRLIAHIEKDFGIKLPIREYLKAQTLGDVYSLISTVDGS
jgi:acyl carrier protein